MKIGDFLGDIVVAKHKKTMAEIMKEALEKKEINLSPNIELKKMLGGYRHFIPEHKPKIQSVAKAIDIDWDAILKKQQPIIFSNDSMLSISMPIVQPEVHINDIVHVNLISQEDTEYIFEQYIKNKCCDLKRLGNGNYGIVYEYKEYAIKVFSNTGTKGSSNHNTDYIYLEKFQDIPLFNKLYCYLPYKFMVTDKVNGITLSQLKTEKNMDRRINFIQNTNLMELLIELQLNIKEANTKKIILSDMHDSNIMINDKNKFIIVDLGHCYENNTGNNVVTYLNSEVTAIFNMDYLNMKPY